jgi:hypothetical protein
VRAAAAFLSRPCVMLNPDLRDARVMGLPLPDLLNVLHGLQTFMVERSERAWPKTDRLGKQEREAD